MLDHGGCSPLQLMLRLAQANGKSVKKVSLPILTYGAYRSFEALLRWQFRKIYRWVIDGSLMQQHYYSVLADLIMASAPDNPQLRRNIYELARGKLRRRLAWETEAFGQTNRTQQLLALEAAIEQIEADFARNIPPRKSSGANIDTSVADAAVEIIPPARHLPPQSEHQHVFTPERAARPASSKIVSAFLLVGAAILGAATYVAVEHGLPEDPKVQSDLNIPRKSTSIHSPDIPIPVAYGVYAISDGQMTELEPLPVRVSDRGATISATISTASTTRLPNGRTRFIIFKRDLVNNVPEKIVVRVVAQIMRASSFSRKEETTIGNVGDSWVIRSTSYEMKVAPVDGNPAMIIVRPTGNDFSFPAGRYALVLNTVAYDFSVDGPITDSAQCVERTEQCFDKLSETSCVLRRRQNCLR
jgi:hypothetical protein